MVWLVFDNDGQVVAVCGGVDVADRWIATELDVDDDQRFHTEEWSVER